MTSKAMEKRLVALFEDGVERTAQQVIEALPDCNPSTVRQALSTMCGPSGGKVLANRRESIENNRRIYRLAAEASK